MSAKKETYYFCEDIIASADKIGSSQYYTTRTSTDYELLFSQGEHCQVWGEASVFYIVSETAIPLIKRYNPAAKIIVILRDPVELCQSWFAYLKLHSREDLDSVFEALDAQVDRARGRRLPEVLHAPIHMQYDKIVSMPQALISLYNNFDSSAVKVLLYDDIKDRVEEVLSEVYTFIGVDASFKPDLTKKNTSKQTKNSSLKSFVDKNKTNVVALLRIMGLLRSNNWLHKIYLLLFTDNKERKNVSQADQKILKKRYRDMVKETAEITGLDLMNKWNY
jgi:hypothetical protein